jgi:hypothetical protein
MKHSKKERPAVAPTIATLGMIVVVLAVLIGYTYVTSSSQISDQSATISQADSRIQSQSSVIGAINGRITSFQTEIASLNASIIQQVSARQALDQELAAQNATISSYSGQVNSQNSEISGLQGTVSSYSGQVSSQNSEISGLQSTVSLQAEQTIANSQTINMAFNSSTTVASFTASYGGYIQISGASSTYIVLAICYGATSQSSCDSSTSFYQLVFGTGGATYNAPLMPGPVWINAYNYNAGTATISIVERT